MRSFLITLLALGLMSSFALASGPENRDQLPLSQLLHSKPIVLANPAPSAGGEGLGLTVVFIPEYYYGHHKALTTTLDNTDLAQASGNSHGVGLTFLASKVLTDVFTLSFIYQFAYNEYSGGSLVPPTEPVIAHTDQHAYSNMAGLIGAINLGPYGKIEPSLLQGWDMYKGTITPTLKATNQKLASTEPTVDSDMATSLMVWYSVDIPATEQWIVTPFVGWRSIYVVLHNDGEASDNAWAHLATGGLSVKYASGPLAVSLRAGISHRVSADDIPGLSTRAVTPSVTHMGWMSSFDRTVGTYGVGLDYVVSPSVILSVSYDGFAGRDTNFHKGGLSFIFPF